MFHSLSSVASLAHIVSSAGLWAVLAQTSLLGKQGLHCPELDFFPSAACLSNLAVESLM